MIEIHVVFDYSSYSHTYKNKWLNSIVQVQIDSLIVIEAAIWKTSVYLLFSLFSPSHAREIKKNVREYDGEGEGKLNKIIFFIFFVFPLGRFT